MAYGDIKIVRALAGISEEDISDEDLTALMQAAEQLTLRRLGYVVSDEKAELDKTRTTAKLAHTYVVTNSLSLSFEKDGQPYTPPNTLTPVLNPRDGTITFSEPLDEGVEVRASYVAFDQPIEPDTISLAVNYLTAHLATQRLENPETVTLADLEENVATKMAQPDRFLSIWNALLRAALRGRTMRAVIPV